MQARGCFGGAVVTDARRLFLRIAAAGLAGRDVFGKSDHVTGDVAHVEAVTARWCLPFGIAQGGDELGERFVLGARTLGDIRAGQGSSRGHTGYPTPAREAGRFPPR